MRIYQVGMNGMHACNHGEAAKHHDAGQHEKAAHYGLRAACIITARTHPQFTSHTKNPLRPEPIRVWLGARVFDVVFGSGDFFLRPLVTGFAHLVWLGCQVPTLAGLVPI